MDLTEILTLSRSCKNMAQHALIGWNVNKISKSTSQKDLLVGTNNVYKVLHINFSFVWSW